MSEATYNAPRGVLRGNRKQTESKLKRSPENRGKTKATGRVNSCGFFRTWVLLAAVVIFTSGFSRPNMRPEVLMSSISVPPLLSFELVESGLDGLPEQIAADGHVAELRTLVENVNVLAELTQGFGKKIPVVAKVR